MLVSGRNSLKNDIGRISDLKALMIPLYHSFRELFFLKVVACGRTHPPVLCKSTIDDKARPETAKRGISCDTRSALSSPPAIPRGSGSTPFAIFSVVSGIQ